MASREMLWAVMLVKLGLLSAVFFFASLLLVPVVVARLPADFFLEGRVKAIDAVHPALRPALRVLRAVLGLLLLGAGLAMLVLPGQGLLTLFASFLVLEFPGKRRLELALLRRPIVARALRWLRLRAGRPPFQIPES